MSKKKIAIVGVANLINYGSNLTYFALAKAVEKLGYDFVFVLPPLNTEWGKEKDFPCYKDLPFRIDQIAARFKTKKNMQVLNKDFDVFLLGSDQFLRPDIALKIGRYASLDWVKYSKKKSAYATSFGYEDWRSNEKPDLNRFDFFGVREQSGVDLAKHEFGIKAEWVLDPVFLCDKKYYDELAEKSKLNHKGITAYILDMDDEKRKIIDSFKKPVYEIYDFENNPKRISIEDYLRAFKNSEMIITDSFHGVCFALIYHKPFIAISNVWRGVTRFSSILSLVGLSDRLVNSFDEFSSRDFKEINWAEVDDRIAKKTLVCQKFLRRACAPSPLIFLVIKRVIKKIVQWIKKLFCS